MANLPFFLGCTPVAAVDAALIAHEIPKETNMIICFDVDFLYLLAILASEQVDMGC